MKWLQITHSGYGSDGDESPWEGDKQDFLMDLFLLDM